MIWTLQHHYRWTREGADCASRTCTGQVYRVQMRGPLRLLSIADIVDSRALEGKGMSAGDTVGRWTCSKCSRRGWIYWRDIRPAGRSTI